MVPLRVRILAAQSVNSPGRYTACKRSSTLGCTTAISETEFDWNAALPLIVFSLNQWQPTNVLVDLVNKKVKAKP